MRVQKKVLFLSVFLMIVGFAAVSTTLYLNGTIGVGSNEPDFDVYFSKAVEEGVENNGLIQDKTHLAFTTELSKINEKYTLEYDVTNASKQYDASIRINCVGGNEYLRVENKFNVIEDLKARSTRSGRLTLTVIKSVFEETEVNISCEITGSAKERTETGGDTIEAEQVDYLKLAELSSSATTYLGHELDRTKVESITLKDTKEVPVGAESWDVSNTQNGSILAYTLDEDNNDLLELYIGQKGGVSANPNSSYLFQQFKNVTSINGLENFDTSDTENLNSLFSGCEKLINLNVGHFDASNVISMNRMFYNCRSLIDLDLSSFDTSSVTNMTDMFCYCINLKTLNLNNWNTNNVIRMAGMFNGCNCLTTLDVSHFDTSNVTTFSMMFQSCRQISILDVRNFDTSIAKDTSYMFSDCEKLTSLDVSRFNTSHVTNMNGMFRDCSNLISLDLSRFNTESVTKMESMFSGCSELTNLDISHFDTSNVTDMSMMFFLCNKLTTTITIRGTKCESYLAMFEYSATSEDASITVNHTEDASDLVDQMIATKSSNSNVVKGSVVT